MERRSFLEKIVPGLKDFRDSRDLTEGFGENPPEEVTEEIQRLNRRVMLKAAATTAVGGVALVLGYIGLHTKSSFLEFIKENPERIYNLLKATTAKYLEIDSAEIAKNSQLKNFVDKDGELKEYDPTSHNGGIRIFGFSPRKSNEYTLKFREKDLPANSELEFSVDAERLIMTSMKNGEELKTFHFSDNIGITKDYLLKNGVDELRLSMPITYSVGDEKSVTIVVTQEYKIGQESDKVVTELASISVGEDITKIFEKRDPNEYQKVNSVVDKTGNQSKDAKQRGKVSISGGYKDKSSHTITLKSGEKVTYQANTDSLTLTLMKEDGTPASQAYTFSESIALDYEYAKQVGATYYKIKIEFDFETKGIEGVKKGTAAIRKKIEDYSAFLKK